MLFLLHVKLLEETQAGAREEGKEMKRLAYRHTRYSLIIAGLYIS
jgi:hypothetical protein